MPRCQRARSPNGGMRRRSGTVCAHPFSDAAGPRVIMDVMTEPAFPIENHKQRLNRRAFLGATAAAAAAGVVANVVDPERAVANTVVPVVSSFVSPLAPPPPPSTVPGTIMATIGPAGFVPVSASPGATVVWPTLGTVYHSTGGDLLASLALPAGARLVRADCYGNRATFGTLTWAFVVWDVGSGSASQSFTTSTASAGSSTTIILLDQLVAESQQFGIALLASSADAQVKGVAYQFRPPGLDYHSVVPFRTYDSRWSGFGGPLGSGSSRLVSVKDSRNLVTGGVLTPDAVPDGASAITFNLTIADTQDPGFLAVVPGNAGSYSASTINWTAAGSVLANASTVQLDPSRQVKVFAGGGGRAQFIIDVTGYFL
jgi:hypothetical protein